MRFVLLGPQGAGKGTYAKLLSKKFNIPHVSIGEIYRSIPKTDPIYDLVRSIIDKGHFVPEEITYKLIFQRLSQEDTKNGFILDGYPRMLNQAKDFENMLKDLGVEINYFFFVEIPEEETIRRLSNRLSCICGEVYNNLTNPPKTKGKCDKCGKDLFMREDDKPEIIKERLRLYHEKTALVKDYFKEKVKVIDGKGSIETVFNRILEILK